MALPHYKLPKSILENSAPKEFPILLAPADPTPIAVRLKKLLSSQPMTSLFIAIFIISGAAIIWQIFDPQTNLSNDWLKNKTLLGCAITALASLLLLILAILTKAKPDSIVATPTNFNFVETQPFSQEKVLDIPPSVEIDINWYCENWESTPFVEVLEEAVMAEIFSDEMMTPDYLVFTLEVEQKK